MGPREFKNESQMLRFDPDSGGRAVAPYAIDPAAAHPPIARFIAP
jgi:hypothetical protein